MPSFKSKLKWSSRLLHNEEGPLGRSVRIVLSVILIFSSLGIGKGADGLFEGFVASLLKGRSRRLEVVRGLLVQCHRELGSCLLAVEQVSLDQTCDDFN